MRRRCAAAAAATAPDIAGLPALPKLIDCERQQIFKESDTWRSQIPPNSEQRPTNKRTANKRPTTKRPTTKRPTTKRPTTKRPANQRISDRLLPLHHPLAVRRP